MGLYCNGQTRPNYRNSSNIHCIILLFLALLLLSFYEGHALPPVEQDVLLDMKQNWEDPDEALASWIKGNDCSTWHNVTCESTGNVIEIWLNGNQLSGSIPSSIGNLKSLTSLDLSDNQFSGPIPSSLGNLTSFYRLWLYKNRISGPIPSSIGKLSNLQILSLANNQLSGLIPSWINNLSSLTDLYLESNYFIGTSPISCSNITNCAMNSNCLAGVGNQRSSSDCSSFCGANSTSAPCSGHGTCAFDAQNNATCTCEVGRSPPNCLVVNAFPSPSPSPSPLSKSSNVNLGFIIGIIVAIFLFFIVIAIVIFVLFKKYKKENINGNESNEKFRILQRHEFKNEIQNLSLKCFSLKELQTMTRGFDVSMILGSGGFGTVYKGILPGGEICAVKKAHRTSDRLLLDFQNEAFALAQLNHFNIVKLLGYCDEANENILIYEYLENGSLSKMLLLPKDHPHFLNFEKRVQIAKDCAQGLNYLHNFSNKKLIHRDVKSDNILLDANFTAKIADFGLLKINDKDLSAIPATLCGTPGYIDPEYFQTLTLTNKSDVFSFGVVLLELVTGKRSTFEIDDPKEPNGKLNESLVSWARPILQSSNLDELIDPNLKEEYEPTTLQSLASLAASCLRPSQKDRPGMDEVSARLGVIMYGKASEIQEGEIYTINVKDSEFFLSNDGNTNSSSSSITNRVPVMSRDFVAR